MRPWIAIFAFAVVCPAETIQLQLTPPTMLAQPGEFAGFGYQLEDDRGYAVPTFSEFSPALDSTLYLDGSLYTDFVSLPSNFVIVAPGGPAGQDFDPVQQTGLGELFVFPSAPPGTDLHGTFTLHYDLYSGDPTVDPDSFVLGNNAVTADVDIQVQGPIQATPEPSSFALAASAIGMGLALSRFRRK